jgi:hypothetical protein
MNEPALGRELYGRVFTDGAWIPSLRSRTIRSQARGSWDRAPQDRLLWLPEPITQSAS